MKYLLGCLLLVLSFIAMPAYAQTNEEALAKMNKTVPVDGRDMKIYLDSCKDGKGDCLTYPLGVVTGSLVTSSLYDVQPIFCLPKGIKDNDVPAAIQQFMRITPDSQKWAAPAIVIGAMKTAFPCPSSVAKTEGSKDIQ